MRGIDIPTNLDSLPFGVREFGNPQPGLATISCSVPGDLMRELRSVQRRISTPLLLTQDPEQVVAIEIAERFEGMGVDVINPNYAVLTRLARVANLALGRPINTMPDTKLNWLAAVEARYPVVISDRMNPLALPVWQQLGAAARLIQREGHLYAHQLVLHQETDANDLTAMLAQQGHGVELTSQVTPSWLYAQGYHYYGLHVRRGKKEILLPEESFEQLTGPFHSPRPADILEISLPKLV